jgi:hypothetical protein
VRPCSKQERFARFATEEAIDERGAYKPVNNPKMYDNNHSYFKCIRLVYSSDVSAGTLYNWASTCSGLHQMQTCGTWPTYLELHRHHDMLLGIRRGSGSGHKADLHLVGTRKQGLRRPFGTVVISLRATLHGARAGCETCSVKSDRRVWCIET